MSNGELLEDCNLRVSATGNISIRGGNLNRPGWIVLHFRGSATWFCACEPRGIDCSQAGGVPNIHPDGSFDYEACFDRGDCDEKRRCSGGDTEAFSFPLRLWWDNGSTWDEQNDSWLTLLLNIGTMLRNLISSAIPDGSCVWTGFPNNPIRDEKTDSIGPDGRIRRGESITVIPIEDTLLRKYLKD